MNPTPDRIRDALAYVSPACERETWVKVGMAIKSELPGDDGFALFDGWSQQAGDAYDPAATRDTWRSIKPGGRVGIGTLFKLAKDGGWQPRPDAPPNDAAQARAQRDAQAAQRAQQVQEQAQRTASEQGQAAHKAEALWAKGSAEAPSGYLVAKGVQAYGTRTLADGTLLVPLRDETGKLWNLQRIAPGPRADGGPAKVFMRGGRKVGCWHALGDWPSPGHAERQVLLLAEGYATAATLHEATGLPVAVAFDAGNLRAVAQALRAQYPADDLVLCADDDAATRGNPGLTKARQAAQLVGGLVAAPQGLPKGGTDWNDLHAHIGGAAGLAEVKRQVLTVLSGDTLNTGQGLPDGRPGTPNGAGSTYPSDEPANGSQGPRDRFRLADDGVWFLAHDKDGNAQAPQWVCSRLEVQARTRGTGGDDWGYLLRFADPQGRPKQWAMPARMLSGDGGEFRAALLGMGLLIAQSTRARNLLSEYIQTRSPDETAICTDRVGWHGRAFVLPKQTIGGDGERVVFQSDGPSESNFATRGDVAEWRERVGALCVGNSRLLLAVGCALAAPLLRVVGMESGGFHLRGDSSSGKTTALRVAASVYGGPNYMQRWRTTDNALEVIAAQHSDSLLVLDELAQVDPRVAGEAAYMLANEQSKGRSTRTASLRQRLTWRLLFLSAGEIGLADHMGEGGKRVREGQALRMADVSADAGAGLGAWEELHGYEGGAGLSKHLGQAVARYHGAVGLAWLHWLADHLEGLKARLRDLCAPMLHTWVPAGASGQVERVASRFALVAAAGELATEQGLTGWPDGEATRGVRLCFESWLSARGGIGNGEEIAMLRQVRQVLEVHGEGSFPWWHRALDDRAAKTVNRWGFRQLVVGDKPIKDDSDFGREFGLDNKSVPHSDHDKTLTHFYVLPESFKREVCKGFEPSAVARVLHQHGCLVTGAEAGRLTFKARLPGLGPTNCYRVSPRVFELDV